MTATTRAPRPGPDPLAAAYGPRAGVRLPRRQRRPALRKPTDLPAFVHWARWARGTAELNLALDRLGAGQGAPLGALAAAIAATDKPVDDIARGFGVEPSWARPVVSLFALKSLWDIYAREARP